MFRRTFQSAFSKRSMSSFITQLKPGVKFFESPSIIFSPGAIKRNYDVIPILGFTLVCFTCECLDILRIALTRDDVRYSTTSRMACEMIDFEKPRRLRKPPKRKMFIFNQKYEWSPGLIDAIREPTQEEINEMEKKKKKQKK